MANIRNLLKPHFWQWLIHNNPVIRLPPIRKDDAKQKSKSGNTVGEFVDFKITRKRKQK